MPAPIIHAPSITLRGGVPVTTSLDLAAKFGKSHKRVLKAVARAIQYGTEEFTRDNYIFDTYTDRKGREHPLYWIARSGFDLLLGDLNLGRRGTRMVVVYMDAFGHLDKELHLLHDRIAEQVMVELRDFAATISPPYRGPTVEQVRQHFKERGDRVAAWAHSLTKPTT